MHGDDVAIDTTANESLDQVMRDAVPRRHAVASLVLAHLFVITCGKKLV